MVAAVEGPKGTRFARGIQRPKPEKLAAIQALLERDPTITQAELARRVGLSKAGLTYYLRHLRDAVEKSKEDDAALRDRIAYDQVELVGRVSKLAQRMEQEVFDLLDRDSDDLIAKSVAARMSTAYGRLVQLQAQLAAPQKNSQTNIQINNNLQALSMAPLNPAMLSPVGQAVHLRGPSDAAGD